jgi:hypothetical protein
MKEDVQASQRAAMGESLEVETIAQWYKVREREPEQQAGKQEKTSYLASRSHATACSLGSQGMCI